MMTVSMVMLGWIDMVDITRIIPKLDNDQRIYNIYTNIQNK